MTTKARILYVEDDPLYGQSVEAAFKQATLLFEQSEQTWIPELTWVRTGAEADQLLEEAATQMKPYDVFVVDVQLPHDVDSSPSKAEGERLLARWSRDKRACIETVTTSKFKPQDYFETAVEAGVSNITQKRQAMEELGLDPESDELELIRNIFMTFQRARLSAKSRWDDLIKDRMRQRMLHACAKVSDVMADKATDAIGAARDRIDTLVELLAVRFQIDVVHDEHDDIARALRDIDRTVSDVSTQMGQLRQKSHLHASGLEQVDLESVVRATVDRLRPGFIHHQVSLVPLAVARHTVHTFPEDVEVLVEEILFNAIEASREGDALEVDVEVNPPASTVDVTVRDRAPPIEPVVAQALVRGETLSEEDGYGWGLSLAQTLAHNIGARITVQPCDSGNRVTLQIPLTADDTYPGR